MTISHEFVVKENNLVKMDEIIMVIGRHSLIMLNCFFKKRFYCERARDSIAHFKKTHTHTQFQIKI